MSEKSIRMDRLDNRYIITGELELLTPMSISSGKANPETDSPFIRTMNGTVYIPGSSLRGAFRSTVERILASLGNTKLTSCILFEDSTSKICLAGNKKEKDNLLKKIEANQIDEDGIIAELDSKLCGVCKVFGSTFNISKVRFTDLYPVSGTTPSVVKRDGVGIDRDTETAVDGAKFDYEVAEKDAQFHFEMIVENVDEADMAVLSIGLNELIRGELWVGGNAAAGLGRCMLNSPTVSRYFTDINSYLESGYSTNGKISLITSHLNKFLEV
ncbi:MAG: CRISPR-associated RAMP protein Csx7 [Nitrospirota bacterium]|nr:CRISPR-associated RAMP protein Csx7 [Nitrospirota bacterium]